MLRCSHVLCRVNNISQLVRDYESLGFTLEWGSAPGKALNALLWFEEGPFIEFFQIPRALSYFGPPLGLAFGRPAARRWKHWYESSEGWCDVALEPTGRGERLSRERSRENLRELKEIRTALNRQGIATSRVIRGARTRPDGIRVRYALFAPEPVALPFVVSRYDPPQRPAGISHPNGASGIQSITMGITEKYIQPFQTLIGGDTWLKTAPSLKTGVLEVALKGIRTTNLNPERLHGAVFTVTDGSAFHP
jgi:hypothetical protein